MHEILIGFGRNQCILINEPSALREQPRSAQSILIDNYRAYRSPHLSGNELVQMSLLMDGACDNEDKSVSIMRR